MLKIFLHIKKPSISLLLFLFFFFLSCSSSKKMIVEQNYDKVINKSVAKLLKKSDNTKAINNLQNAYKMANDKDLSHVKYAITKGDPDVWESVYNLYRKLKFRQANVSRLPQTILRSVGYEGIDYDDRIIEARNRAANYTFLKGKELFSKGDKMSYRDAFYFFKKTHSLIPSYPNLTDKIETSKFQGTSFVYITVDNNSDIILPKDYEAELNKLIVTDIGNEWLVFTEVYDTSLKYDYYVNLNIKEILISPEGVRSKEFVEKKTIEDGWEYVLDNNGNVKKDDNGNDIKQNIVKEVQCFVTKYSMHKSAKVKGTINAYNHHTKQLLLSEPLFSESFFTHEYGVARGDRRALTSKSKRLVRRKPLPFPNNIELILQTNSNLKKLAKSFIQRNSKVFI